MDDFNSTIEKFSTSLAASYAKIAEMGGEIPDQKNSNNLGTAIRSIPTIPQINPPDLAKPLNADELKALQEIVARGEASSYYQIGQAILVTYSTYTMPFEIVGFEDVEVEGGSIVHAINLLAKYTNETDSQWGDSGNTEYSTSTLRSSLTTYQGKLNADFLTCLANTKTQTYSRDGSTDVVYDKLFAPSMAQLGVTSTIYNDAAQAAVEGPAFTAYQGSHNAKRLKQAINATGTAQNYWTRSFYPDDSSAFDAVYVSGAPDYGYYFSTYRSVAACNFIGQP